MALNDGLSIGNFFVCRRGRNCWKMLVKCLNLKKGKSCGFWEGKYDMHFHYLKNLFMYPPELHIGYIEEVRSTTALARQ